MVFATTESVSPAVTKSLDQAQKEGIFERVTVNRLLTTVDKLVFNALNPPVLESEAVDSDEDADEGNFGGFMSDTDADSLPDLSRFSYNPIKKIRTDLRVAKLAGFRIGHAGNTNGSFIVSIACRAARFGISEDAMQAWNMKSTDYFILLICYARVYLDLQEIFELGDTRSSWVQMRVGLCDSYKPSARSIEHVFDKDHLEEAHPDPKETPFRSTFISEPLNKLLNERFLSIITIRRRYNFSWTSAELFFHHSQGKRLNKDDAESKAYQLKDTWATPAPSMLLRDHFAEKSLDPTETSFPLVAMQYTLRHFVKCGEFCLVCHCKTFDPFESLKPYVCSNGLCLYQYISFGMGSSLEYEIHNQPMVVDLLVSLAYNSASMGRLQDFPTGLGLKVPKVLESCPLSVHHNDPSQFLYPLPNEAWTSENSHGGVLDPSTLVLTGMETDASKLLVGTWVTISLDPKGESSLPWHEGLAWSCQITGANPEARYLVLSEPMGWGNKAFRKVVSKLTQTEPILIRFLVYDTDFDDLNDAGKRSVIKMLLDTLPDVNSMREYLTYNGRRELSSWDHISPAALDILRWIVASNRSCIRQDHYDNPEHLVTDMKGYVQFRLIQGAPDKEHRFMQAVNMNAHPSSQNWPTLLAWHGSPVHNWHSILREGLHFKNLANGRAFGNGVYLSSHFVMSLAYSHASPGKSRWPSSTLNMERVLSLNEVVNCPSKFLARTPHFVVASLDWIQPRYLFVGMRADVNNPHEAGSNSPPPSFSSRLGKAPTLPQDPKYHALGPEGKPIEVPISAISQKRRQALPMFERPKSSGHSKRSKVSRTDYKDLSSGEDGSVDTAIEDLEILLSGDDNALPSPSSPKVSRVSAEPAPVPTNAMAFEPGTLDRDSLPLLAHPSWGTTTATQLLQRHLQTIIKTQRTVRQEERGWTVDPNLISTVYQWIVELHSFDNDLPLANDLKTGDMQSIVLEMRFPDTFPMSPPFVRVIRPRFLEFASGGGGHVTIGGAMCMELLTSTGWSPVASMESVLIQVRLAICSTDPQPARLRRGNRQVDYGIGEAVSAFRRACVVHGWQIPPGMERFS